MNHSLWAVTGDLLSTLSTGARPCPLCPLAHYNHTAWTFLFKPFAWDLHLIDLHMHCPHGRITTGRKGASISQSVILFECFVVNTVYYMSDLCEYVCVHMHVYLQSERSPGSFLGVWHVQEGLGQVSSSAHRAESHTTPSPKVSAFSSKHTHASPTHASSRISSFSRCSSKVSKGLVCVQATQQDHF